MALQLRSISIKHGEELYTFRTKDSIRTHERIERALKSVKRVGSYMIEIYGEIEKPEEQRESLSMLLFGSHGVEDQSGLDLATHEFYSKWSAGGHVITGAEWAAIDSEATQIVKAYCKRTDHRTTQAQRDEKKRLIDQHEQERKDKRAAWVAKFAGPDTVTLDENHVAITAQYCYNDSDSMTDYYHPHHDYGELLCLAILPKVKREDEATLRRVLAGYPTLAAIKWEWHTEKYSMGHGNYLDGPTDLEAEGVETYGHHTNPPLHIDIEYTYAYRKDQPMTLHTFPGYPGTQAPAPAPAPTANEIQAAGGVIVTTEGGWTWVKYPSKPDESILEKLHALRGRFSGKRMSWYFTRWLTEDEINSVTA